MINPPPPHTHTNLTRQGGKNTIEIPFETREFNFTNFFQQNYKNAIYSENSGAKLD